MSKQDRQDWIISLMAWAVILIAVIGNYIIHGGRLV